MANTALTSIGVKALTASYAGLQTTGQNIANANVAGYSRQSVVLTPTPGQFTGSGYFGGGVDVSTVVRAYDAFLSRDAADAKSVAAMDSARLALLGQLETVFPVGEQGLGYATTRFFDSIADLATYPSDLSVRQVVLARADDMASQFRSASAALDTLQAGVRSGLTAAVAEVNSLAQNIAGLNESIQAASARGQPPNDLLDRRDELISQLASRVQVTRIDADDGSVGLFIAGGQSLVLGTTANALSVVPDSTDPSRSALGIAAGPVTRQIDADALGGGDIAGLLQFQNHDLVTARNLIDQFAGSVASAVNAMQANGLTLGAVSGSPMFATGTPPAGVAGGMALVLNDPRDIAAASAATPASAVASNNENAVALLGLRDSGIVAGRTPSDFYAEAMSIIGTRVQSATTRSEVSTAAAAQARAANSAQTGVNLDEEAARLIQYQQSYQAAAKVLQVAQTLFDSLLRAAGG